MRYLIKVRAPGDPHDHQTKRVIEAVYEITPTDDGTPTSSLRYQWDGLAANQPA